VDADKQAHYASCAQAEGVSLPVARRLLAVFLEERTPSVAQIGRLSQAAAQRSTRLLPSWMRPVGRSSTKRPPTRSSSDASRS